MEALRDIIAGTAAGSAGIFVGYPLDTIVSIGVRLAAVRVAHDGHELVQTLWPSRVTCHRARAAADSRRNLHVVLLDSQKVRLQTQAAVGGHNYGGLIDATRLILRNEGFPAMFRGVLSPLYASLPVSAVTFGVEAAA